MNPNKCRKMSAMGMAISIALAVSASDLYWTGASNPVWDRPGYANWTNAAGQVVSAFANGDNVCFSGAAASGGKVIYTGDSGMAPGSVVFDVADELTLRYGAYSDIAHGWGGLRSTTGSFVKRGAGVLKIDRDNDYTANTFKNDMRCGMSIEAGRVDVLRGEGVKTTEMIGAMEYNPTFTVAAGAELRIHGRRTFSDIRSMDINAVGNPASSTTTPLGGRLVLNGGTFSVYADAAQSGNTANAVRELTLNDGALVKFWYDGRDCTGESTYDNAIFRVVDKVTVGGTTRSTLQPDTKSKQKWMMEPTAPVEFAVADVTSDSRVDFFMTMRLADFTIAGQPHPHGAFKKTGVGTMQFLESSSAWKGDIDVAEGTLLVDGPEDVAYDPATHGCTVRTSYLGDLTDASRSIVVRNQGTLQLANRTILWKNTTYAPTAEIPAIASTMKFKDGGRLKLTLAATPNSLGPLLFDDGDFVYEGGRDGIEDMIGVYGRVTIRGSQVKTWPTCAIGNWYLFNEDAQGNNVTVFDVADITGSPACDFEFGLHLSQPRASVGTGAYGFDKEGVGTMRLMADNRWLTYKPQGADDRVYYGFNGVARVKAGTLQVDGNFASNRFAVASGAFLSGTGTVGRVTLESGAGFMPQAAQARPLTIVGDLSVPSAGVIDLCVAEPTADGRYKVDFAKVDGELTGADAFTNWTFRVNGQLYAGAASVRCIDNVLRCSFGKGLSIIIR